MLGPITAVLSRRGQAVFHMPCSSLLTRHPSRAAHSLGAQRFTKVGLLTVRSRRWVPSQWGHGGGSPHSEVHESPDATILPESGEPGSLLQAPQGWEGPYWLLTPVTGLDLSETDAQQAFINPTHDHEGAASCQTVAQDSARQGCRGAGWPPATSRKRPGYQSRN